VSTIFCNETPTAPIYTLSLHDALPIYEPRLNENFEGFAQHYGMSVVPARAYKPKDKALVENAVKLAYRHIYKHIGEEVLPLAERSEEHTSELQSRENLVCRLLLEKKKK